MSLLSLPNPSAFIPSSRFAYEYKNNLLEYKWLTEDDNPSNYNAEFLLIGIP